MLKRFSNKNLKPLSSFTLAELLIATLIFSIVAVIAASFFITVLRAHRRADLEDYLYSEARLMMEKIGKEISSGTIDYEEYYNRLVKEGEYGENYQAYGQQFWNPGTDGDFGSKCNDGNPYDGDCIRLRETMDENTGQNPYSGDQTRANAFCDEINNQPAGCAADSRDTLKRDQLYLINNAGNLKTIIAKELITTTGEHTLSIVRMEGSDTDRDDVIDTWVCTDDFSCAGSTPDPNDLVGFEDYSYLHAGDFVPITPLDLNIKDIAFIIKPADNPHKAFAEDAMQIHPRVIIKLTVQAGAEIAQRTGGNPPEITLQSIVSTSVYRPIESFKPPL